MIGQSKGRLLPPATKQGYIFTGVCDSVHGGRGGISACIAGGIPACLAAGLQGGGNPACLTGFQAHTKGGSLGGSGRRGLQTHTKGEIERGLLPGRGGACSKGVAYSWGGVCGDPPGWLLLRAVRILLECILVTSNV